MKWLDKTLQNMSYFWNMKTHVVVFLLFYIPFILSPYWRVYVIFYFILPEFKLHNLTVRSSDPLRTRSLWQSKARTLETCPWSNFDNINEPSGRIVTTPTDLKVFVYTLHICQSALCLLIYRILRYIY